MQLSCPHCAAGNLVPDNANGPARCHRCRKVFAVPSIFDLLPPAPPPPDLGPGPLVPLRPAATVPKPKTKPRRPQPDNDDDTPEPAPPPAPKITKKVIHHYHPAKSAGGCGPVMVELIVSFFTAGFLGGCGPIAAGKGSTSLCISILAYLVGGFLVFASAGLFLPFFLGWLFVKWIIDLVLSAS